MPKSKSRKKKPPKRVAWPPSTLRLAAAPLDVRKEQLLGSFRLSKGAGVTKEKGEVSLAQWRRVSRAIDLVLDVTTVN